jgi:hypothetical protein
MPASKYRTAKKTVKKKKRTQAKQYKAGAKLAERGKKQAKRTTTRGSKELGRAIKSGELKSGPKKSTRYKTSSAAHKIASGTKMMEEAYGGKKVKKTVGMKRTAPGAAIGRKGKTVSRRGKVKR